MISKKSVVSYWISVNFAKIKLPVDALSISQAHSQNMGESLYNARIRALEHQCGKIYECKSAKWTPTANLQPPISK